jgi:hypothetical protein
MREREGVSARVCKVEENTPFRKYANAAWAERGAGGLRGGAGRHGGGAGLCNLRQGFENLHKEI